jgi:hypothetical protein
MNAPAKIELLPDDGQLDRFIRAIFKHADPAGFVALRAFPDGGNGAGKALFTESIHIGNPQLLAVVAERAKQAAQWPAAMVFCPPLGTYKTANNARADNILEGLVLSVDCDQTPRAAYEALSKLLGKPTIIVASGGSWKNPETGEAEPKVHQHWRLNRPARTSAEHATLREARDLAVKLVGGDATNIPICHPLRWPGSWHRKNEPKLARIVFESEHEIDLADALAILREAVGVLPEATRPHVSAGDSEREASNHDDVIAIADILPNQDLSWADWNKRGMTFWAATNGSEKGYQAFEQWSAKSGKYVPEQTRERWDHYFSSPPQQLGMGSLVEWAKEVDPKFIKPSLAGQTLLEKLQSKAGKGQGDQPEQTGPLIKSSRQFTAGFTPPDYAVVGLIQRRFCYSLTGQTGSGKTAVTLRLAASAAMGIEFAGRKTKKTRVLYAAAENPDDVRMRWIALAPHMGFEIDAIDVFFTEGCFSISKMTAKLSEEAQKLGGDFGLVIIDTSPAFFEGDDENSRTQMGAHARLMRGLINVIPGGPAVIANCHPVKNAAADNLLPAGGGTYLNEVDGNFTCAKSDSTTEMHWQGKFRGPEFAPMNFIIKTVTHQNLKDSDGRLIPTVICEYLTEQAKEEITAAGRKDEDKMLELISSNPRASYATLAAEMAWKLHSGDPNKMKSKRCVAALVKAKLIKETRSGGWTVTPAGKRVLDGGEE